MSLLCVFVGLLRFSRLCIAESTDLAFSERKTGDLNDYEDDFPFTTVIDLLSQNPEFSVFLRILQVQGHIPYLNSISNFTLLAPVNSAFIYEYKEEENEENIAAIKLELQDYIISNLVLDTVDLVPGTHLLRTNSYPILLIKGGDGRCAIDHKIEIVEPNLSPNSQNATIQGVDSLVKKPLTLSELVEGQNEEFGEFSIISHIFQSEHLTSLFLNDEENGFFNKTLFLPTDKALKEHFNDIELNYLFDLSDAIYQIGDHEMDFRLMMKKMISNGIIGGVIYENSLNVTNMNHEVFNLFSRNRGKDIVLNGSIALNSNMLYDKGIVHFVSKLPLIKSDIVFNAEKYVIGMNASSVVQELHFRNLEHLIQSHSIQQTIFISSDSSDSTVSSSEIFGLSRSQLLYHFIEKPVDLKDDFFNKVWHTRLYDSMFCSSNKRLGGNCQRIKISKFNDYYYINEKYRFISADPVKVDGTFIYMIEDDVTLPGDLIPSINPFYHCSTSLNFMQQLNLLDLRPNDNGYTLMLPCFDSWDSMELNVDYLHGNISAMNLLMKSFILNGLIYSDSFNLTLDTTDLYGSSVIANTDKPYDEDEVLPLSLSTFDETIFLEEHLDMVFSQGVVHPLKEVFFPKRLNITLENLIETIGTVEFLLFLEKFEEFQEILNGSAPYSILVPTPRSLLLEGIDLNYTKLEQFLKLHIIPQNQTTALINCEDTIGTTLGESLRCREASEGIFLLSVEDGLDKEVRILKKGCTSNNNLSCIFLIDRPFSLKWLNRERYRILLPGVSFALGILLGILFLFSLLLCIIVTSSQQKTQRVQSRRASQDAESQSLLQSPESHVSSAHLDYQSTVNSARSQTRVTSNFESSYSSNARTAPVMMSNSVSNNMTRNRNNEHY